MRFFRSCLRSFAFLALILSIAPAHAQPASTPWAEGVSAGDQTRARALFEKGNAMALEGDVIEALAVYEQAVGIWDHPAIRFNMATVLIRLERPVAAYENIERALRFGADALEPQEYDLALKYRTLLQGQVTRLRVTCDEPGARVTLDGKLLFVGRGEVDKLVLMGEHQVVASKPGRRIESRSLQVMPRILNRVDLGRLVKDVPPPPVLRRRWPVWKPWGVSGGGAAVILVGAYLQYRANQNLAAVPVEFDRRCGSTASCPEEDATMILALEDRAILQNRAAVGSFVVGGAVVATGLILAIINQPRPVPGERPALAIVPHAHGLGVGFAGRF